MTRRQRGVLDVIAGLVPGYLGYADREARRGDDQRLRAHVADTLDRAKGYLNNLVVALTRLGRLEGVADLDVLKRRLGTCADALRHAQCGASGLMDDIVVRADDLDRVHDADLALDGRATAIETAILALTPDNCAEGTGAVVTAVGEMQAAIASRDDLFSEVFECRS